MCMNPQHFLQSKFLHDEEKIMKSISKSTFRNITRYKEYSQIEYIKKTNRKWFSSLCRCYYLRIK